MNKGFLTGAAIVLISGVVGYGALSYATKSGDAPSGAASTGGTKVADSSGSTAGSNPLAVFPGTVTETGGFTGDVPIGGNGEQVTIIEYASLTCPHCAAFHDEIYKAFKPEYIDTNKVRFIFRDYPLDNFALTASLIARCGGQSKYLGFVDLFMSQQATWRNADSPIGELKRLAKFGGLTEEKINTCMNDAVLGQSILDRARVGQVDLRVKSTPTILINGRKFEGPMNLQGLKDAVDGLLN